MFFSPVPGQQIPYRLPSARGEGLPHGWGDGAFVRSVSVCVLAVEIMEDLHTRSHEDS